MADGFRMVPGYHFNRVSASGRFQSSLRGRWADVGGHRRGDGYVVVSLKGSDGRFRNRYLHDLVALAFLGETPEGLEVCFRNGVRSDCRLENLYWGRSDRRQARHRPARVEAVTRGEG